jgi:hypothetical protein
VSVERRLVGQRCWHVSAGESTLPSFTLVLGDMIRRQRPLRNQSQPETFRLNRGSTELLVWCSWRLQDADSVLASSDQGTEPLTELQQLIGQSVVSVECTPPAWDLRLRFSNERVLVVFCDHADEGASIAQNWELYSVDKTIRTGPGVEWEESEPIT